MIITIIGGSGFIGTRLTKRLLEAGHTVRIADKRCSHTYPQLWKRCDVRNAPEEKNEFAESITDADTAPGADAVYAFPSRSTGRKRCSNKPICRTPGRCGTEKPL